MGLGDGIKQAAKRIFWNAQAGCCILFVLVVLTISLIATSIRNVDFDEYGIVYNSITKTVSDEIRLEGKHVLPVGSQLIIFKRRYITMEFNIEDGDPVMCLSKNGLEIILDMTMQYQWDQSKLMQIFRDFGDNDSAHNYLVVLARETFREVCSYYRGVDFYDNRAIIEKRMLDLLTAAFVRGNANAQIGFVQLLNIQLPYKFDNAISAFQLAKQDIEKAKQEKDQVVTKADTRVKTARNQANRQLQGASATADGVLYAATQDAAALNDKFRNLAFSFSSAMNSTGLSAPSFIGSYLQSKLLREATQGAAPIVAFS